MSDTIFNKDQFVSLELDTPKIKKVKISVSRVDKVVVWMEKLARNQDNFQYQLYNYENQIH